MAKKAIPVVVRERILKLYDQGKGPAEIAAGLGYCVAAVRRVRQRFKERGTLKPQTHRCGRKTHLTSSRKERLLRLLARRPDATLSELGAPLERPTSTLIYGSRGWAGAVKKRGPRPSSRGPTWRSKVSSSRTGWPAWPPTGWCSWMKAGPIRR